MEHLLRDEWTGDVHQRQQDLIKFIADFQYTSFLSCLLLTSGDTKIGEHDYGESHNKQFSA